MVSGSALANSCFQPVEVKQRIWTSCWMEGSDLMTEAEVLCGFQVSPQPTHTPETKGAEGATQHPLKAALLQF